MYIQLGIIHYLYIFVLQSTNNMNKHTNKKSRCTKKYLLTADEVRRMLGCSESYVKQVRLGKVNTDTPLAQLIIEVDNTATQTKSLFIQEIERIVKL